MTTPHCITTLRELHAAVDDMAEFAVQRRVDSLSGWADVVREDALISGALPGDFKVVLAYQTKPVRRLVPRIA